MAAGVCVRTRCVPSSASTRERKRQRPQGHAVVLDDSSLWGVQMLAARGDPARSPARPEHAAAGARVRIGGPHVLGRRGNDSGYTTVHPLATQHRDYS